MSGLSDRGNFPRKREQNFLSGVFLGLPRADDGTQLREGGCLTSGKREEGGVEEGCKMGGGDPEGQNSDLY